MIMGASQSEIGRTHLPGGDSGEELMLEPRGQKQFGVRIPSSSKIIFLRPSADWVKPTPTVEGNLLYSKVMI